MTTVLVFILSKHVLGPLRIRHDLSLLFLGDYENKRWWSSRSVEKLTGALYTANTTLYY